MRRTFVSCLLLLALKTPLSAQSHPGAARASQMIGFGRVLLVAGGDVIIGEPLNAFRPGRLYVFRKTGTAWRQAAILSAPDSALNDVFGRSIAVTGQDLLIGAPAGTGGRVHVFRKQGTTWRPVAVLAPSDLSPGDQFGLPVVADGDWAMVGATTQGATVSGTRLAGAGAVYVFRRGSDGTWAQAGKLSLSDPKANDGFGSSLAIAGGRALVGVPGASERQGATLVYADSGGTWREAGRITRNNLLRGDGFGSVVRLAGPDAAIVGAPFRDDQFGAVFVYLRNRQTGAWQERARLAGIGTRFERFPGALAGDGRELWVGAPFSAPGGRVYVYAFDSTFVPTETRVIGAGADGEAFGRAVAVQGNVAAVAATGANVDGGAVTIYERAPGGAWRAAGTVSSPVDALPSITGGERKCTGKVGVFGCKDVDLRSFMSVTDMTTQGRTSHLSGMWGWTDPETNREIALVGRTDGTAFVDVTDPTKPVFLGDLPKHAGTPRNSWREIRTYKNFAYIVSEGAGHGMQVFDLTQLRTSPARTGGKPVTYSETAHYDRPSNIHNVAINEESGFAYLAGAGGPNETCGGALHMVDIRDPKKPAFAGCSIDSLTKSRFSAHGIHDAQCVMYRGPDTRYTGRELCFVANETALSIQDVTDKAHPKPISRASHTNTSYLHQGWFTEDQRYWYANDELDEVEGTAQMTRTIIWDLKDLEKPTFTEFYGTTRATDHNLFVVGNLMYQSNYQAGLRILDVSDPLKPVEVGYFDTAPYADDVPGFEGTWANYPFFKSGTIVVSSGNEGLFLLKKSEKMTP